MNGCCRNLLAVLCAVLPWLVMPGCGSDRSDDAREVYPARPIKLIVPFGPGGGTGTFARIIEKAIEDEQLLPQPMVIINQGGVGATIGSRTVKDAAPDGYTVLILHDAILTAKFAKTVEYGPEAFEPVAATGEVGMVIVVDEDSPYQTLGELMEAAQSRPETVSFGANIGAPTHFAGLQLEQLAPGSAFRFAQIGGGADRFSNLKGGHIAVTGFSIEEFIRFRTEGLRGLAFFGAERHPGAPDVPTAREQGFNVAGSNTFYWWVPRACWGVDFGNDFGSADVAANDCTTALTWAGKRCNHNVRWRTPCYSILAQRTPQCGSRNT